MNGIHDLGGRDGFGPVDASAEEPVFRDEWEKHVFAMFPACFRAGYFGLDEFRHGFEQMDPAIYLRSPYYEHWLFSMELYATRKGFIDAEELERRTQYFLENPDAPLPEHEQNSDLEAFAEGVAIAGAPPQRPTDKEPRFQVGDIVRVKDYSPFGHTRLAQYIRGKVATVIAHHGSFIYPDSAGNGLGEAPEHVYTIQFDGAELWGADFANANTTSTIDVFDPYIELVNEQERVSA